MVRSLSINRLAYLNMIRNVRQGLERRSEILRLLDHESWITTSDIAQQVNVTYHTVLYHLRNLMREEIVERNPDGKGWRMGPIQQSELLPFFEEERKRKSKG